MGLGLELFIRQNRSDFKAECQSQAEAFEELLGLLRSVSSALLVP